MKKFVTRVVPLLFAGVLALGACGGESFDALADEVCKCTTKECADKVGEKWEKLSKELLEKDDFAALKKADSAEQKAEACVAKLK